MRDGLGDALAEIAGAGATLRARAAGPEYVGGTPGARADGGVDIAFPNGPTDAEVHVLLDRFHAVATYSQMQR